MVKAGKGLKIERKVWSELKFEVLKVNEMNFNIE
jgi:hypothetical protein